MSKPTSFAILFVIYGAVSQTAPSRLTNLPYVAPGVFSAQASVIIDESIQIACGALLDFLAHPEWNPFVRSQTVTNAFWLPLTDQTPHENQRLIIQAQIPPLPFPVNADTPPNLLDMQYLFESITAVDMAHYWVAWKIMVPDAWLTAERWQARR